MYRLKVSIMALLIWGTSCVRCDLLGLGSGDVADTTGTDYANAGGNSYSYGGSSYTSGYSSGDNYNAAPVVTKNVYIHVAPEEPQYRRNSRILAPSQPRRKYKIIFIKAPSQPPPVSAKIQLPQQDEEKTLIYILSKKRDEQAEIKIQDEPPTKPSKPEVYFIRYKTPKTPGRSYGSPPSPAGFSLPARGSAGDGSLASSYGVPTKK